MTKVREIQICTDDIMTKGNKITELHECVICTRTIHHSCSNEIRRVVGFEYSDIIACSAPCVNINECPQLKEIAVAFVKSKGKTIKKEVKKEARETRWR